MEWRCVDGSDCDATIVTAAIAGAVDRLDLQLKRNVLRTNPQPA
jgi:hypothetical protein